MGNPLKILVVDPNHNEILQMANAFRQQGWEIVVAGDAVVAQSVIRKEKPELIVLSSHLPGGGAALVVRRIRSSVHTVGTPVIVLGRSGGAVGEILAAGANEYLKPPLNVAELCVSIRALLEPEAAQVAAVVAAAPASIIASPSVAVSSGFSAGAAAAPALAPIFPSALAPIFLPAPVPAEAPARVFASPERLAALAAADVLDSPRNRLLDSMAHIAAATLVVPVVLLSIVDQGRQFFKSQFGLPEPWASKRETPLSHSFCQSVVSSAEELIVDDARNHPALQANLAVQDLGVIAYAGVPVTWNLPGEPTPFGQPTEPVVLGSFCAIDSKPRAWSAMEMANLRNLARMAEAGLLLEKSEKVETENITRIRAAATILLNSAQLLRRNDDDSATSSFRVARGLLLELIEAQAKDSARWIG